MSGERDLPWRKWKYTKPIDSLYLLIPLLATGWTVVCLSKTFDQHWYTSIWTGVLVFPIGVGYAIYGILTFDNELMNRWREEIVDEMVIHYGVVAVTGSPDQVSVLHFVGYEQKPTQSDFDSLLVELKTDPEFGLSERTDWRLMEASPEMVMFYTNQIGFKCDTCNIEVAE